jgi:hypothetical protein
MRQRPISALFLAALAVAAGTAIAQQETPPGFEFSFSNPGARSMGFGGAFVALADDATAAFANPAGLIQLVKPEVSFEGRSWSYSTPYVEGGRGFGPATGQGLDVSPGLRIGTSSQELTGLSFLSLVYPWKDFSVAFYHHQAANFEFVGETEALFFGPWEGFPGSKARSDDYRKSTELEIANYGASAGYRVTERLSVGLGVGYFQTRLQSLTEAFDTGWGGDHDLWWSAYSHLAPELLDNSWQLSADDTGWGFLAGILWHLADERWTLGAVYRHAPEIQGTVEMRAGPMHDSLPDGTVTTATGRLPLPDVIGLGASFRSRGERLTLGFEWDRVGYSAMLEAADSGLVLEDADELRAGAEYVFRRSTPVAAVRLGAWLDPAHQIGYRGGSYTSEALLLSGSDEIHLAAGLGLAFERFQLDLGVDFSDIADVASLSTIYSF